MFSMFIDLRLTLEKKMFLKKKIEKEISNVVIIC